MSQLVLVLSIIGLPRCEWELGGLIVAAIVQLAGRISKFDLKKIKICC